MSEDTLKNRLLSDRARRPEVVSACVRMVEDEVAAQKGIMGLAVKGGFKVVQAAKPGFVREAMDSLLDDFVDRIEEFWTEHLGQDGDAKSFEPFLKGRASDVSNALLGITDDRAKRAQHKGVKKAYDKLRPQAQKLVTNAIPRVAKTLVPLMGD